MEVQGKVKMVGETQTFGSNGFRKRELVVTTNEQYPQHVLVEFVQDKCDLLNGITEGQDITVSINLRGREWVNPQGESKYFNSIQGWRVEASPLPQSKPQEQAPQEQAPPQNQAPPSEEDHDDLPF